MYWIIFGIVDLFVLAVFGTLLHLRKKKRWESLFNDYELKEDLPKEVQEKYWEDATALDAKLFFRIFLLIQLGAIGSYFTAWIWLFIVCAAIYIVIWYRYAFLKIKVKYQKQKESFH